MASDVKAITVPRLSSVDFGLRVCLACGFGRGEKRQWSCGVERHDVWVARGE